MTRLVALALLSVPLMAQPARAEVAELSVAGFVTQNSAFAPAPPAQVWAVLVRPAGWWNSQHSWSGDATNLTLSPTAGGCFCEALADGGSVEHARVVHAAPGRLLRLRGALGPLQAEALNGTLTVTLTAEGEGTRIDWTYVVGGHARFPLAQIAPVVDRVQSDQLHRLAALFAPLG